MDFVDQERLALAALEDPDIAASLAERLEVAFVDEFQDTNPLQLALFVALSRIAYSSVWVGDPKQAIYGFRGTDPQLIKAVAPKIVESTTGGVPDTLKKSFRSRPGLVHFVNNAFGPSFKRFGLPEDACTISEIERQDLHGQSTPLAIWNLATKPRSRKPDPDALAHAVVTTLRDANDWMVTDSEGKLRLLEPGDIAILCRTNNDCAAVAEVLTNFGIRVSTDRKDLLKQPEAKLATAAMRWTVDPKDVLAMAEMAHLLHDSDDQPSWFSAVLEDDREARLKTIVPFSSALRPG